MERNSAAGMTIPSAPSGSSAGWATPKETAQGLLMRFIIILTSYRCIVWWREKLKPSNYP